MASGGIQFSGGIAPRIVRLFRRKSFLEALRAKGRMQRCCGTCRSKLS
ncbi:MAG: glucokinase [Methylococcales bacterium]